MRPERSDKSVNRAEEWRLAQASDMSRHVAPLVEHFFRHEFGRLVSVLARVFSLKNLDLAEEVVQAAFVDALRSWSVHGVPDNPAGWLQQTARNKILDVLRHRQMSDRRRDDLERCTPEAALPAFDDLLLDTEIADSQLRMMFACCHPLLAHEDQLALTLKTLCGFSNAEIARALLAGEEAIKKRIQRAKRQLVDGGATMELPAAEELEPRLAVVQHVLYLLFNEGYSATEGERAIREELCEEAARLCSMLALHPRYGTPATMALLALMLFHAARLEARLDEAGRILLLEDQDRTKWDRELIEAARRCMDASARGERVSAYHLEAGIAMQHCLAGSFAATDWTMIVRLYDALLAKQRSPLYLLNRAIALAHLSGPQAGIDALAELQDDRQLADYHLLDSTLGELHRRAGRSDLARQHFQRARDKTRSQADRELLDRKLRTCD